MSVYGNELYNYRDNKILTEAYIGKTDLLLEIEKQIGVIRHSIKFFDNLNRSKEVIKLNRLFEKQFGMDIFALKIYNSDKLNSYTRCIGTRFDIAKDVKMSEMIVGDKVKGYRFRKGNNFCVLVYISYAIFKSDLFTDSEILAIMLHEIGHNFADCIYDKIEMDNRNTMNNIAKFYYTNRILLVLSIIGIPVYLRLKKMIKSENNGNINKHEGKSQKKKPNKLKGLINGLKGKKNNFSLFVNEVIARLGGGYNIRLYKSRMDQQNGKEKARESLGRRNEVIADKFAGIYGYGPDQASALLKMDFAKTKADKFINDKLWDAARKANDDMNEALLDITDYDVHPHVIQRINEEIKLLEKELAKEDIDPKVVEVLKQQIQQCKDLIDEFIKNSNKFNQNSEAKKLYYDYVNQNLPDAISDEIEAEIEQALDDALEKK